MAFLIPSETPRNSPSFPIISLATSQDKGLFNILNNSTLRFTDMGRNSPHPLVSPPTIPTDALQLPVARNAKSSVTSAKIVATINAEDAFGGDQDIPPLTVKLRKKPKEYGKTKGRRTDHGDTMKRQENNGGKQSTHGQEWLPSQMKNGIVPKNNQKSST
jgi:hypothetical protein